jgi:RND family efflux transporter MFP subunit
MRAYTMRLFLSVRWVALAALLVSGFGCVDDSVRAEAPTPRQRTPVSVAAVEREPVTRTILASGTLEPRRQHALSFKVGGVIASVLVDEGARVKKGQVLARLDATELLAGESQAQQALQKAQRDAQRARTLRDQNGIARSAVDDAETALEVARAAAASTAFNLRHTTLTAPCDGVIDRRDVEVGQIVGPGAPLFLLSSAGPKVVRVHLTDRDVLDLQVGDAARVLLDARPGAPLAAKVARLATLATPGTGTYEVELAVDDAKAEALPAGLTAKVTLERLEHPKATIPLTALVGGEGDRASVFVLQGDRVMRAPVRIAFLAGERVALAEGLDGVDRVVSAGTSELTDGMQVRVVR